MSRFHLIAASVFAFSGLVLAQDFAAQVGPNPAVLGEAVRLRLTNQTSQDITFIDSAIIRAVSAERPGGTKVWMAGEPTGKDPRIVPPGGMIGGLWSQHDDEGNQVAPGHYWLVVEYWIGPPMTFKQARFSCTIVDKAAPTLRLDALTSANIGSRLALGIRAEEYATGNYFAFASLSTNTGIELGYAHAALDFDDLFLASALGPDTYPFVNFQGSLDVLGEASSIVVSIPDLPELAGRGFFVQALLLPGTGPDCQPALTNCVAVIIGA